MIFFEGLIRPDDEIGEDSPSPAVQGNGVFVVSLADHLLFGHAGHLFHGSVPGDNLPVTIDRKGRVGDEIDDLIEPPVCVMKGLFRLSALRNVTGDGDQADDLPVTDEGGAADVAVCRGFVTEDELIDRRRDDLPLQNTVYVVH